MKLATVDGLRSVRERRYPFAGLDSPTPYRNGDTLIQLASSPRSPQNWATFAKIYRSNPWVFAAVQAISWALSRLPLKVYQTQADSTIREIRPAVPGSSGRPDLGQQLASLLQMPEPGVSQQEWLRKIIVDKLVYGNSFAASEDSNTAVPAAIYHYPWRKIEVHTGDLIPILKYTLHGDKSKMDFTDLTKVLHVGRSGDLDSPLGLSPIEPLRYTVALHDAIERHLLNYFSNAARPSGMLKVAPGTRDDVIKKVQKLVEELYSSPENAGKIMVTSADWQSLSADPRSAEIVALAKLSREEIAAAYQVPQPVIGILERAIQANVVELRSQFLRDVVGPHAAGVEGDLNAQLIWNNPALRVRGYFLAFDMMKALRPDLTDLATVFEKLRHVMTIAEQREFMGLGPLTGNDLVQKYASVPWMPSGQIPIGLPQPQVDGALAEAESMPTAGAMPPVPQPAAQALQAPYA